MTEQKKRFAVSAGHICLDITPAIAQNRRYNNISEYMVPGRLIPVGKPDIHTGGSVGNTGLAMKVLGADVKLMGKVGNDDFGRLVLEQVKEYGAGDGMIMADGDETSYSVVVSVAGIDRIILHDSGANNTFCMTDIDFDLVRQASLFHFGYPSIMASMYQNEGQQLVMMMKKVKEMGVATSMDMAIVDEDSEAGQADWEKIIRRVIPYVDIFAPSVEELAFLIDRPRYHEWLERSQGRDITEIISVEKDVRPLAEKLLKWGAKIILIKCGAPGLYFRTGSAEQISQVGGNLSLGVCAWADCEYFERSYKPERILSGTGAGDTSIAAFLCAVLEGCPWEECLHLAAGTGASCVAAYDALSGLKSFSELREKIAAGWEKI